MKHTFYENTETNEVYANFRMIAKSFKISATAVHLKLKKNELPIKKLPIKEVLKRAQLGKIAKTNALV